MCDSGSRRKLPPQPPGVVGGDPDPGGFLGFQICSGWQGACGWKSLFSIESLLSLEGQRAHWVLEEAKRRAGGDAGRSGGPSVS